MLSCNFWRIISFWQAFNCSVKCQLYWFFRWLYHLCEIKDNCVSANFIRRVFSSSLLQFECIGWSVSGVSGGVINIPWNIFLTILLDTNHKELASISVMLASIGERLVSKTFLRTYLFTAILIYLQRVPYVGEKVNICKAVNLKHLQIDRTWIGHAWDDIVQRC